MTGKYLEAVRYESKISRRGLRYKIWTFEEICFEAQRTIYTSISGNRLFFGNKADSVNLGDQFIGEIKQFKTTAYQVPNRVYHDTITVVVFGDESGIEIAAKALQYFNAFPYDEHGNLYERIVSRATGYRAIDDLDLLDNEVEVGDDDGYSYNNWGAEEIRDIFGGDPDATWNLD